MAQYLILIYEDETAWENAGPDTLQRILEEMVGTNQALARTIDQVQAGREKLRGSVPTTNVDIGPEVQMPELEDEEA